MSGRYEVSNRYSAYIEARRNYLEQSDSEEDVEIQTILRRPHAHLRTVSSSSEEPQPTATPTMVLVPTVTIQEPPKEIEIATAPAEKPSVSTLQEIHVESAVEEVTAPEPIVENSVLSEPSSCSVCSGVEDFLRSTCENLKSKSQKLVDFLLDPSLHATIRSEFLQYLPTFLVAFAVFLFFITSVSIVKLIKNGAQTEPSLFCKYFAGPFAPLFDALCAPEPYVFSEELPKIMGGLVDEMLLTFTDFLRTITKGFTVFGTLFTAIGNGLSENVFFGFHELGENLGENIGHLVHFVVQFVHQIVHFFFSSIATVAGAIAGVFTSVHDYLEPPKLDW